MDAWDLRRLYTFAFRRQNDAQKRGQKPRDRKGFCRMHVNSEVLEGIHLASPLFQDKNLKNLFDKIRRYRQEYEKEQGQWPIEDGEVLHDDAPYEPEEKETIEGGKGPEAATSSTDAIKRAGSTASSTGGLEEPFAALNLGCDLTPEQTLQLAEVLQSIGELEKGREPRSQR